MAENKTKPTGRSVTAFIDALPMPARRADAKVLIRLMRQATGEPPRLWGPSIIGFGRRHYRYASGREGETLLVGFAPRRAASVLYGVIGCQGAAALLARLGRHTTGKGCLYLKALVDVDAKVLATLIQRSVAEKRAQQARVPFKRAGRAAAPA